MREGLFLMYSYAAPDIQPVVIGYMRRVILTNDHYSIVAQRNDAEGEDGRVAHRAVGGMVFFVVVPSIPKITSSHVTILVF